MEGQGVALALAAPDRTAGRVGPALQRVTGHSLRTGAAFYVIWPKGRALTPQAAKVLDWLTNEGRDLNG
jgi:DNA-binding transcriptional LysR family regulator